METAGSSETMAPTVHNQETIRARNATDAREKYFMVNELLLPMLKAFAQCTRYTLLKVLDVFSVCGSRTACRSYQQPSGTPTYSKQTPHRVTHAQHHLRWDYFAVLSVSTSQKTNTWHHESLLLVPQHDQRLLSLNRQR